MIRHKTPATPVCLSRLKTETQKEHKINIDQPEMLQHS